MTPFTPLVLMSVNEDDPLTVKVYISDAMIIGTEVNERVEMETEESESVPSDTSINEDSKEFMPGAPSIIKEESKIAPLPVMNGPDTTETVSV